MNPVALPNEAVAHLTAEGRPHLLVDHLTEVGAGAARFAEAFGAAEWGRIAGRWHDLGKYSITFQNMIRAANGFEAHIEVDPGGRRDHSTAGAVHAARTLGAAATPIAFAIAGHHAGLSNRQDLVDRLRNKAELLDHAKQGGAPVAILDAPSLAVPAHVQGPSPEHRRLGEMWTRMLFSALCDADFLDTEAFYDGSRTALRGGGPPLAELEVRLTCHLDALQAGVSDTKVNRVRAQVRRACAAAAAEVPGVFSLTVPTGGGKTLASLAFALAHARAHGLGRVIVAIPFTAIIEQSAKAYREALLGDDAVLEHHSAFDPARETPQNRIASENWDAPVVVTTTVQLFESLFANRPRDCRKLHRLARSVIVLDEAQTLPPGLLAPILDGLRTLVRHFGATVVICTATQPAFRRTPWLDVGFDAVREIVPDEVGAFERLRRVRACWPASEEPTAYTALAVEIAKERDVLAIVHRRKDARELCELLDGQLKNKGTLHLSALMCPEHRSRVLAEIKRRKQAGEPIRLVSTQLIEAGVDVDFAVVYRALGGMDALAQAAGRCNREGKLPGLGELRIFTRRPSRREASPRLHSRPRRPFAARIPRSTSSHPPRTRRTSSCCTAPRILDAKKIEEERQKHNFKEVADRFKLIEDDWSAPVVVPYGDAEEHVRELERRGPSRERLRALQRFTVTVSKKDRDGWIAAKLAREVQETVVVIDGALSAAYDARFGLVPDRLGRADPRSHIV